MGVGSGQIKEGVAARSASPTLKKEGINYEQIE
jgi:hypothetical protein